MLRKIMLSSVALLLVVGISDSAEAGVSGNEYEIVSGEIGSGVFVSFCNDGTAFVYDEGVSVVIFGSYYELDLLVFSFWIYFDYTIPGPFPPPGPLPPIVGISIFHGSRIIYLSFTGTISGTRSGPALCPPIP